MYTFSEYKSVLESILQKVSFLYSGDIISSVEKTMSISAKHKTFSPILIRKVLEDIYNDSFREMMKKSKRISLSSEKTKDVYQLLDLFNNCKYLFYSSNSKLNIDGVSLKKESEDLKDVVPTYFHQRVRLMSFGNDVGAYYSPSIDDSEDEFCIFISDAPIQSLVWTLQNMTYDIIDDGDSNIHIVRYNFYYCDYNSIQINVKDINKIRDEIISNLLNDN